jgi:hypothetical protein
VAAITVFIAAIGIRWLFSTRPASAGPTGTNTTHEVTPISRTPRSVS